MTGLRLLNITSDKTVIFLTWITFHFSGSFLHLLFALFAGIFTLFRAVCAVS